MSDPLVLPDYDGQVLSPDMILERDLDIFLQIRDALEAEHWDEATTRQFMAEYKAASLDYDWRNLWVLKVRLERCHRGITLYGRVFGRTGAVFDEKLLRIFETVLAENEKLQLLRTGLESKRQQFHETKCNSLDQLGAFAENLKTWIHNEKEILSRRLQRMV